MRNRIITISHAQFWPGITPFNVGDLPYDVWISYALSCDEQVERIEKHADEVRRATRR